MFCLRGPFLCKWSDLLFVTFPGSHKDIRVILFFLEVERGGIAGGSSAARSHGALAASAEQWLADARGAAASSGGRTAERSIQATTSSRKRGFPEIVFIVMSVESLGLRRFLVLQACWVLMFAETGVLVSHAVLSVHLCWKLGFKLPVPRILWECPSK